MELTLTASTGAKIHIWREEDLFHATRPDADAAPQICLAVDLFEVIAELASLDLELPEQADEAVALARLAQKRLAQGDGRRRN
jgi:hypothetical protein